MSSQIAEPDERLEASSHWDAHKWTFGFILALFALMFITALLPIFTSYARWFGGRDWPATACVIVDSDLLVERDAEGATSYYADVGYSWRVAGRSYYSSQFSHFQANEPVYGERAGRIEDYFPPQSSIACYVDPADPSSAVRSREFEGSFLPLVFIVITLVTLGAIALAIRSTPDLVKPWRPLIKPLETTDAYGERILHQADDTLWAWIVISIGVALVWNGFLLRETLSLWSAGAMTGTVLKFLLPSAVGGLLLASLAVHLCLQLLDPRPLLSTRYADFRVGEPFGLHLRLQGGRRRVERVLVTLQGRERATYREGTDTKAEEQIFHLETLLTTQDRDKHFDVTVATDLMHSLETENNQIVWTVEIDIALESGKELHQEWKLWLEPAHPTVRPEG